MTVNTMKVYLNARRMPPSDNELSKLEMIIGRKLPDSFKEFLYVNNGGVPLKPNIRVGSKRYFLQYMYPVAEEVSPNIFEYSPEGHLLRIGSGHESDPVYLDTISGSIGVRFDEHLLYAGDNIVSFLESARGKSAPLDDKIEIVGYSGSVKMAKELLDSGLDINERSSTDSTMVEIAGISGNVELLTYLISVGADISRLELILKDIAEYKKIRHYKELGLL